MMFQMFRALTKESGCNCRSGVRGFTYEIEGNTLVEM